jgi:hypothetical protein
MAVVCLMILTSSGAGAADDEVEAVMATNPGDVSLRADLPRPAQWWLAIGPSLGGMSLDTQLANYSWDVQPRVVWGIQTIAGYGRAAAGLSIWRSSTRQATNLPGDNRAVGVNLTGAELTGQFRVATLVGVGFWARAHGGRLHLGYDPDNLDFSVADGGPTVTVHYRSQDEWIYGLGLELRRNLMTNTAIAVQLEQSRFGLETSHRRGDTIVEQREVFDSWSLRLQFAWILG